MTRKTFERGEAVEVQRDPSAPWEPATYLQRSDGVPGHHIARFPPGAPRIDLGIIGYSGRPITNDAVCVPSRRIRKRSVTK